MTLDDFATSSTSSEVLVQKAHLCFVSEVRSDVDAVCPQPRRLQVKFTHAGHGTANVREIGEPFVAPLVADLGQKNIFMFRDPIDTAVSLYFQLHKTDLAPSSEAYSDKFEKLKSLGRLPPKEIDELVLRFGASNKSVNSIELGSIFSTKTKAASSFNTRRPRPIRKPQSVHFLRSSVSMASILPTSRREATLTQ